ncbi:MAG: bifunctional (p)ppGpp synthetase/guanosine-3',5'-bis(diphosphate) 3'-pyrophosphohydrolase, partial [Clostridia bacterium]
MTEQYEALCKKLESAGGYDMEKINRAYNLAERCHEGQTRISGEPYIIHPIAVAQIVMELQLDTDSVCAAFLHDTIEDCPDKANLLMIKKEFGTDVAEIVDGVTKLRIPFETKQDESIENLRKMFLAMSKDLRVIFIKLADRLHNMRTLNYRSETKQRSVALETMHVYAPLAHRLGIQKIKQELEMLALKYLDPIGFNEVKDDIDRRLAQNEVFLQKAKDMVSDRLNEYNIKFTIEGRIKSIYSIYKKMYNQAKTFDEIYDFYAIRIIVDTELDCYTALGIIHEQFKSMPGRFKDYISTPKPNMYRSIHTTVIGRDGIPFEVQIRTWEMHAVAEYGLAAHWKYKTGEQTKQLIDQKLQWIRTLLETEKDSDDADEFSPLKIDLFEDETFVFTPKGDVVSLPNGSTPIDFAYSIHSAVGNKMVGAKVNGNIVPIDYQLENGQIVEVLTSSASKGPSRDWLKIVRSAEARNKIRQYFKKERRPENIIVGKMEIERELKRYGRSYSEAQKDEIVKNIADRMFSDDVNDLYNNIGYGGLSMSKIAQKLKDEFDRVVHPLSPDELLAKSQEKQHSYDRTKTVSKSQSVVIDSVAGCEVKFAKCCNPLPGDSIIGFITKGYGV